MRPSTARFACGLRKHERSGDAQPFHREDVTRQAGRRLSCQTLGRAKSLIVKVRLSFVAPHALPREIAVAAGASPPERSAKSVFVPRRHRLDIVSPSRRAHCSAGSRPRDGEHIPRHRFRLPTEPRFSRALAQSRTNTGRPTHSHSPKVQVQFKRRPYSSNLQPWYASPSK